MTPVSIQGIGLHLLSQEEAFGLGGAQALAQHFTAGEAPWHCSEAGWQGGRKLLGAVFPKYQTCHGTATLRKTLTLCVCVLQNCAKGDVELGEDACAGGRKIVFSSKQWDLFQDSRSLDIKCKSQQTT